ncbi:MAG: outer membrane lipoprotein LolB [Deltaproteobacteria bacterium]|nr:outer membrane lipoprotein LolB [Deltaproteobacteria bacterium]TLN03965.1 MAG: outer membrane lipoprotein LolB [bacterium]
MIAKKTISLAQKIFLIPALLLALSACATAPKPLPSAAPGRQVETLQSEVSLSVRSGDKSIGGRGYLVFKQPDRFHLAVFSPFGFTLMDLFVNDTQLTCLIPAKQVAYQGLITDIPDGNALKGWGMMRWVVETPPASDDNKSVTRNQITPDGRKEIICYDDRGLLASKSNEDGDRVVYRDYRDRNGVAFPSAIEISNAKGDSVRIVFDEPELNQPVEDDVLTPALEGVNVLPLTAFRGL